MPQDHANRKRRPYGDGSVYKREDGYWAGAFYAQTVSGARKRVVVYGKSLKEVRDKLAKAQQQARSGIPVPDESWRLGPYLEHWLENFVKRNRRPATYNLYEMIVRIYLTPGLGGRALTDLSVVNVQRFFDSRIEAGDSVRKVQVMRTVLSSALTRAVREELLVRNVARLVELPQWQRATIRPWSGDEARAFLTAAKNRSALRALSFCSSSTDYDAAKLWACAGRTSILTRERSRSASSCSAFGANSSLRRSRPRLANEICRYSISYATRSSSRKLSTPPTGSLWALPGQKPGWCSQPGQDGLSSRETLSGRSGASARAMTSGSSRSTTCGTRSGRCSRI